MATILLALTRGRFLIFSICLCFQFSPLLAQNSHQPTFERQPKTESGQKNSAVQKKNTSDDTHQNTPRAESTLREGKSADYQRVTTSAQKERHRNPEKEIRELRAQEDGVFWTKFIFFASVVSIFLTVAALWLIHKTMYFTKIAAQQTSAMLKAAQDANSIMREQQRAWLEISFRISDIDVRDKQRHVNFIFGPKNVGHSPAHGVRILQETFDISRQSHKEVMQEYRDVLYLAGKAPSLNGVILPGENGVELFGAIPLELSKSSKMVKVVCVARYYIEVPEKERETVSVFNLQIHPKRDRDLKTFGDVRTADDIAVYILPDRPGFST